MTSSIPSLGSRLEGARAKVRRANEHIGALKRAMRQVSRTNPFPVEVAPYDTLTVQNAEVVRTPRRLGTLSLPPAERWRTRTIAVRVYLLPTARDGARALRWATVVGEIVHNLASALDNLVHALALANPTPPPPPLSSQGKDLTDLYKRMQGFPFATTRNDWLGQSAQKLYFVDHALYPVIEEAQPFFAHEKFGAEPGAFPLAVVHDLWNRDKHETVNLTATGADFSFSEVRIPSLFPNHPSLPAEPLIVHPRRAVNGRTEIAVLRVSLPEPVNIPATFDVHIRVGLRLALQFGQASPGDGENAVNLLQSARDEVSNLLDKFA
jgi:hypothetical protein